MSSLRCGFLCPGCRPALPCLRPLATLWFPPGGSCFRRMKSPVTALLGAVQFCSVAACPSQPQAFESKGRAVLRYLLSRDLSLGLI